MIVALSALKSLNYAIVRYPAKFGSSVFNAYSERLTLAGISLLRAYCERSGL